MEALGHEVPSDPNDPRVEWRELREETRGQVNVAVTAAGARVESEAICCLAIRGDLQPLCVTQ